MLQKLKNRKCSLVTDTLLEEETIQYEKLLGMFIVKNDHAYCCTYSNLKSSVLSSHPNSRMSDLLEFLEEIVLSKQKVVDCPCHLEKLLTCSYTYPGERMWFRKRASE